MTLLLVFFFFFFFQAKDGIRDGRLTGVQTCALPISSRLGQVEPPPVVLERDGRGLNLTEPVRDGILNHTGAELPITLEGRIVRLVDRVAYINHDVDDALRAGIITADDLPAAEIELLGSTGARRIDALAQDIVTESRM